MRLRRERVGLLVLIGAVSLWLPGAMAQLNPLVTRTPQAGAVPVECAEGVAPAPLPRVDVSEIPLLPPARVEPAELPPPPTGSLRSALEATQTALTRNDRPAFDRNLTTARELLEDYPSGAQRRSAEELVRIYEASGRLWDAQYDSPFFDESSQEAALLRGYPGYEEAVRRSTLTRDGRRYFPAGESRDFLGRVAAERLRGIGIQAPAPRLARNERPGVPDTGVDTPRSSSSPRRPAVSHRSTRSTTTTTTTGRRATRPPRSAAPSRPRLTTESRTPAPATSTPGSPNPPASPTAAAAPEPAEPSAPPAQEIPGPEPAVTEQPADATPTTETTETAAPTTTVPAPAEPAAAEPSRGRSVVLPTILILIGLGVLILLFRASK